MLKIFIEEAATLGVDHAIHRDGGDLGAVDPAVLSRPAGE
jgi:hypothetical protein